MIPSHSPRHLFDLPAPVLTHIVIALARESHGSFACGFDRTSRRSLATVVDTAAHVLTADAAFKAKSARGFANTTKRTTQPPPYEAKVVDRANKLLSGMANLRVKLADEQSDFRKAYLDVLQTYNTPITDRHRSRSLNNRTEVVEAVAATYGLGPEDAEALVA